MNRDDCVEFENVKVKTETAKALLVYIDAHWHWIPKAHVHDDSEVYAEGDEGTIIVSEWIAKKKGLV